METKERLIRVTPKHKIVFLGDQGVGKSSLASRFVYDIYEEKYQPTIGIDFFTRTLVLGECIILKLCFLVCIYTICMEKLWNSLPDNLRTADLILNLTAFVNFNYNSLVSYYISEIFFTLVDISFVLLDL